MEYPFASTLLNTLNAIAGFNTLLVFILLIRYNREYAPANRLLGIYLLGMAMVNLMIYLIESRYIYEVPWLFRAPSPLYYLMFPAAWLYVRMIVKDQTRLRPVDWLHFLPAFLHLLELTPYFLSPTENKLNHVRDVLTNPMGSYLHDEGILPAYAHNIVRAVIGLGYGSAMLGLLLREKRRAGSTLQQHPGIAKWLFTFSVMEVLFSIGLVMSFIFIGWGSLSMRSANVGFWAALTQIVTSIALITNPSYLFGMPRLRKPAGALIPIATPVPTPVPDADLGERAVAGPSLSPVNGQRAARVNIQDAVSTEMHLDSELLNRYKAMLQEYQAASTSFLLPRYTIRQMSEDLRIPQHHLSYVLNKLYRVRFNDFINELRIRYLEKRIREENALEQMTLEGAARDAGFSNRSTFIRAVKRITGKNPSVYFQDAGFAPAELEKLQGND